METLLRIFAVILSTLGLCICALLGAALFAVRFDFGGVVAFLVSVALAVLCVRVGLWLWSERPFWKERRRLAETATAGVAFLAIAATARFERLTDGVLQAAIQLSAVALVVAAYFVFRRIIPAAQTPDEKG